MRTTKPISTIAYNSEDYLKLKLDELIKAKRLSFYAFIQHKPEDDEGGKKYHFHIYAVPSKMLQTDDLKDCLKEFDPQQPDKPRGCISWVSSKFDDWYLYALHDKKYLASKGQSRRYHYQAEEVRSSDPDDLIFRVKSIDRLSLSRYADMEDAQKQGLTWSQYFARGTVPIQLVRQYSEAWNLLFDSRTQRNGKSGHDQEPEKSPVSVDPDTGEVLSV